MFVKSVVSIFVFIPFSEAVHEFTASSENIGNGFYDFLEAADLKVLETGGDSGLSQTYPGGALLSNDDHLIDLQPTARKPGSMADFLELRLGMGSQAIWQDSAKIDFNNQKGNPDPTDVLMGMRPGVSSQSISQDAQKSDLNNQKTETKDLSSPSSSRFGFPTSREASSSPLQYTVASLKPTLSHVRINRPPMPGAMDRADERSNKQQPHTDLYETFWKPKRVKVITNSGTYPGDSVEVEVEAAGGGKVKFRYPEEEKLNLQLVEKLTGGCPMGRSQELPDAGDKKLNLLKKLASRHPANGGFEWKKTVALDLPIFFRQTGMSYEPICAKNRYVRDCRVSYQAHEQGVKELRELGLPTALYSEPLVMAELTSTTTQKFPEAEYSTSHSNVHQSLAPSIEHKCSKVEIFRQQHTENSNALGVINSSDQQHTSVSSASSVPPASMDQFREKPTKKGRKRIVIPGPMSKLNTDVPATAVENYKKQKTVLTAHEKKVDLAKSWISITFPAIIHDIKVICEAFPPINIALEKTIKELQWDAWHFYHIFFNNIEFLLTPEIGKMIWGKNSLMPHEWLRNMIDTVNDTPQDKKISQKKLPVGRKLLALWMSCNCQPLYRHVKAIDGLNNHFTSILNELYRIKYI